jgi:hypothetical protein
MMDKMNESVVNSVIDALAAAISTCKTELENIDELFKKKLEEAKKSLNEQLEETTNQYNYWLAVRGDAPMPEKKPRRKREKKEEIPAPPKDADKVIDTLYPENNEPEPEEESVPEEQSVEETPSAEETKNFSLSGSLFPEEPVVETPVAETEELPEEISEDDPFIEEGDPIDLDNWDQLEEWKQ